MFRSKNKGQSEATVIGSGAVIEGRIRSTGRVQVEVRYASLQIDRGGVLDGMATHGDAEALAASVETKPAPMQVPMPPALPTRVSAPLATS